MAFKFQVGAARLSGSTTFEQAVEGLGEVKGNTLKSDGAISGSGDLTVLGKVVLGGTDRLLANGNAVLLSSSVSSLQATGDVQIDGATRLQGALTMDAVTISDAGAIAGATTVSGSGQFSMSAIDNDGVLNNGGALNVVGLSSLDGGVDVNGNLTISTAGAVAGATTVSGSGVFSMSAIDNDGVLNNAGALNVSGLSSLDGGVDVNGNLTISTAGAVAGATTISGSGRIDGIGLRIDTNGTIGTAGDTDLLTLKNSELSVAGAVKGTNLSGSGTLEIGGTVLLDGAADATNILDKTTDSFYIRDDGDGLLKSVGISDFMTGAAGNGLGASNGVLAVGAQTNGGISVGSSDIGLDLNDLSAASVDVTADSIAIIDGDDSDSSKKESIVDFVSRYRWYRYSGFQWSDYRRWRGCFPTF